MSKTKANPLKPSEETPVKVTRHYRAEPGISHHVLARRQGQMTFLDSPEWKRNPINFAVTKKGDAILARIKDADVRKLALNFGFKASDGRVKFYEKDYFKFLKELDKNFALGGVHKNPASSSLEHPVEVRTYYRQAPASFHVKVRRQGQQDLWSGMDWKRNPAANFIENLRVTYNYDKTIVTTPDGERVTLTGTLSKKDAIKKALKQLVRKNPEFSGEQGKQAAQFVDAMIEALDVENDGDLDAGDVEIFEDYDDGEPGEKVTFETFDDNAIFGDESGGALEVTDDEGERDGVIIDQTKTGLLVVQWIDDDGEESINVEHPDAVLYLGAPDAEQIKENPVKYVLEGVKNSTGKRFYKPFPTRAQAVAKRFKLEKTGNFSHLKIKTHGSHFDKQNPDWESEYQNELNAEAKLTGNASQAFLIGKRIGKTRAEVRNDLIENGYDRATISAAASRPKRNPDLATAANFFVGLHSAIEVAKQIKPKRRSKTRKNPSKSKAPVKRNPQPVTFEMFNGRKATKKLELLTSHHSPTKLEGLGDLHEIKLVGKAPFDFSKNGRYPFKLCSDRNGHLHIAGGRIADADDSLKNSELAKYGEIDTITYRTIKPFLGDTEPTLYKHKFGEEGGERPELCADLNGYPVLNGGSYYIKPDYDGKHSSGIRD